MKVISLKNTDYPSNTPPVAFSNFNQDFSDATDDEQITYITDDVYITGNIKIIKLDKDISDDSEDNQEESQTLIKDIENIPHIPHTSNSKYAIAKQLVPSLLIATGTGVAMMPIFNHMTKNSKDFGIDIHSNKNILILSTANTFIITSFASFWNIYKFFKNNATELEQEQKDCCISFGKFAVSCSSLLHLSLLWGIELNNQKSAASAGFDQYIAWATFSTLPLMIDRTIESIQLFDYFNSDRNITLKSFGSKLCVYGLTGTAIAGRMIAYTGASMEAIKAIGGTPQEALIAGIIIGGVVGSGGLTAFEYKSLKYLFEEKKEELTTSNIVTGVISALQGAWLTIPIISIGLNTTDSWNPLLKGVLFAPLFASHSILEGSKLYDSVNMCFDTIKDCISSTVGQCNDYTDLDIA
jgi:hypothetical protein